MVSLAAPIAFVNNSPINVSFTGIADGEIVNPQFTSTGKNGEETCLSITAVINKDDKFVYANGIATVNNKPVPISGELKAYTGGKITVSGMAVIPQIHYTYQLDHSAAVNDENITRVSQNMNADYINAGTISADRIGAQSIDASKIVAGSITSKSGVIGELDAGSITTGTLCANQIAASSITGEKIAAGTITANNIKSKSINADLLAAGCVNADSIAVGAITADKIVAGEITGDKLAAQTITANNIAANAITSSMLSSSAISAITAQIGNLDASVITSGKISGARLDLSDYATFSSLSTPGSTVINGSNITSGTISGNRINGGTISGVTIDAKDTLTVEGKIICNYDGYVSTGIQFGTTPTKWGPTCEIFANNEGGMRLLYNADNHYFSCANGQGVHIDGNLSLSGSFFGNLMVNGSVYSGGKALIPTNNIVSMSDVSSSYLGVNTSYMNRGISYNVSDIRLKCNFADSTEDAISKICSIRHYSFDWLPKSGNTGHVKCGVTAQELQKIDPEFVFSVAQPDGSDLLQVDDFKLLLNCTRALQQLQEQLKNAKTRIEMLETKISTMQL